VICSITRFRNLVPGYRDPVFGRPFVKRFALWYRTVVCLSCGVGVLWPNGWIDQDAIWYGCRPRPRRHCIRWGPSPSPKKWHSSPPLFGPCLLWL